MRYLVQFTETANINKSIKMLKNLGATDIQPCAESMNIYCFEADEGTIAFINDILGMKIEPDEQFSLS